MKKRDFKALILMGIASGSMALTQGVESAEAQQNINLESTFAGGAGGCGGGTGSCASSSGSMNGGGNMMNGNGSYMNGSSSQYNNQYQQRDTYDHSEGQPYQQQRGGSTGCSAKSQRTLEDRGYSQRNIRNNQKQIAESNETMPTDDTITSPTPTTPKPPKNANSCGGSAGGCNGKNLPRQYRTRN